MKIFSYITLSIFFILMMVSGVSAKTFSRGTDFQLTIPCSLTTNCTASQYNITVVDEVGNIVLNNVPSTINPSHLNISINSTQSDSNGIYEVFIKGSDGSQSYTTFSITPSGEESKTGDSILYSLFSIILFGIILGLAFFVFTMPGGNERDTGGFETKIVRMKYIRVVFIVLIWGLSILLLNFLNALAVNITTLTMFSGVLGFLFETMLRLTWPFIVIMIAWIFYMLVHDSNLKKQLKKIENFNPFENGE